VKLTIAWIGKTKDRSIQELTDKYLSRLGHYATVEGLSVKDETKLVQLPSRDGHSTRRNLIALDSRGQQYSSEGFAQLLRKYQESGATHLVFAIGGADGFNDSFLESAELRLSLGEMTWAHELARVLLLEQLYRAFTILKGHPYHTSH